MITNISANENNYNSEQNQLNPIRLKYILIADVKNNFIICDYPSSIPLNVN
jgi:hypothetical protein